MDGSQHLYPLPPTTHTLLEARSLCCSSRRVRPLFGGRPITWSEGGIILLFSWVGAAGRFPRAFLCPALCHTLCHALCHELYHALCHVHVMHCVMHYVMHCVMHLAMHYIMHCVMHCACVIPFTVSSSMLCTRAVSRLSCPFCRPYFLPPSSWC